MPSLATDWYAVQKRAEEKVAKAAKRREQATFEHQQAEAELERIKLAHRTAERLTAEGK